MNIVINTNTLRNALHNVIGVLSKDVNMPILRHVLIEKNDNQIDITGTNLQTQITAKSDFLKSDDFDPITVPGRELYEIVRSIDNQDVQITATKKNELSDIEQEFKDSSPEDASEGPKRLVLKTNNSTFKLATLPVNRFNIFDNSKMLETFTINEGQLLDLLNKTSFSMASTLYRTTNYYLYGLLLDITPNMLTAVATDLHRLAICSKHLDKKQINNISCIVPRKAVLELIRILQGDKSRILQGNKEAKVSIGSNQIRVDLRGLSFVSQLLAGEFPMGYRAVIPTTTTIKILLEKQNIRQALQRVSILANERDKGIRIEASNETIILSSENPGQGEAKETIKYQSDPTEQKAAEEAPAEEPEAETEAKPEAAEEAPAEEAETEAKPEAETEAKPEKVVSSFKANYLIEAINACSGKQIVMGLNPGPKDMPKRSSASKTKRVGTLIYSPSDSNTKYVIMPFII